MSDLGESKTAYFQTRSHLFCNLIIFLTPLLIFLFVPFYVLTSEQAQQAFNNGRGFRVFLDILILTGLYFAVVGTLYWIFSLTRFRQFGAFLALFFFAWVAFSGFLLPLTTASGTEELGLAPVRSVNLILVSIFSVVIAFLWLTKYAKIITVLIGVFLLAAIIPSTFSTVSSFEKRSDADLRIPLSKSKNLLLISFDGIPGQVMTELLAAKPEMEKAFKDFRYFKNAVSTAPSTDGSLQGVMFGNSNLIDPLEEPHHNLDNLFMNDADKYNFVTGMGYSRFNKSGTAISAGQFGVPEQRYELYLIYRPVFARLFTKIGVWIIDILEFKLGSEQKEEKFYSTVFGIETMTDILDSSGDKPGIFFSHFVFTHSPTSIDNDCTYRGQDKAWLAVNQNKAGVVAGVECGLKKYVEVIEKLKSLGVYDNTIIVFASDHGKLARFYENEPQNYGINNHLTMGYDRYRPFLMIKNVGQVQDRMEYVDKYVLIDDLAKTLCIAFDGSENCHSITGLDLLDPEAEAPDNFYIHVARDATSTWRVHTMKSVKLPRDVPLEQAMRDSDEIVFNIPGKD